jgi:GntR family transcriptional regulator
MGVIRPESQTPKHRQHSNLLRERIDDGDFTPGDRIPSEAQLGLEHRLSRITVRQALSHLERDGLLERVPGKGTFVRRRESHVERPSRLTGFGENVVALGLEPGYRTLAAEPMRVSKAIADCLRAQSGKVFMVKRVLLADGEPIAVHTSYLPLWIVKAAPTDAFSVASLDNGSLYQAMAQAGVRIYRADEIVEPGLANADEAHHLEMEEGALLLRVERTVFDRAGTPIEYVLLAYRADSYTYRTTLYTSSRD